MKVRTLAYEILCDVMLHGGYANLLIKEKGDKAALIDRPLLTQLVYKTLQLQIRSRALWMKIVHQKPSEKLSILLDLAVTQLYFFDRLPAYAVIDESVETAKSIDRYGAKMVNAVLRKMVDLKDELHETDDLGLSPFEYLALPEFVYRMWLKQYGAEKTFLMAEALLEEAAFCAALNPLKLSEEALLKDPGIRKGQYSKQAYYSARNWLETAFFREGQLWIQDEISQLAALKLEAQAGHRILDSCSAPGGKTAKLASGMNNEGEVIALDLYEHRVRLVENQMRHLGITNVRAMVMDARRVDEQFDPESFDRILIDAPCSGLGVLRRKADIKLRITPERLDEIQKLQKEILEASASLLKQGGRIVYSTCTLNKKENEKQIEVFCENHPEFECVESQNYFPDETGCDGFYIAVLIKKEI